METATKHPLERAADGALEKAAAMGGHRAAHWNHDTEDWTVRSATDPGTVYQVWRKRPDNLHNEQSALQAATNRGWWWFTLECNCPAIVSSGYAVCKHKACVRLWQLHYHRRDGRAWGNLPPHSNAIAQANDDVDDDGTERWKDRYDPELGNPFDPEAPRETIAASRIDGDQLTDREIERRYAGQDIPYYAQEGNQERLPW
jgi:hypothetical protein